ncbi:MAG TPA: hypothetical protein VHV51_02720, partial [Polyangiaceae bacterium]|nr:hypothetical protein [Polyangiaceae bacterium]
ERDEMLVTRVVDGEPDQVVKAPLPTIMPVVTAVATSALIIACIFTPWGLPVGAIAVSVALAIWFWPTDTQPGFKTKERAAAESLRIEGAR